MHYTWFEHELSHWSTNRNATSVGTRSIPCPAVDAPSKSSPVRSRAHSVVWAARVVWILLAVIGGSALGQALDDHSRPVQLTGTALAWSAWAAIALALVVPSTLSLTVVRAVAPASVVVAVTAAFAGADTVDAVVCVTLAVAATAAIATGEFGQIFAQASAYGDEVRFVLRPPLAFLVPAAATWSVLCALSIVGPLVLAGRNWFLGLPLTMGALALAWFLGRRFHRLSRRWLVLVPAGIVVHDHLVLAETVMFQRKAISSVGLALAGTEAADLTGPTAGHAVEVALHEVATVVLAPTRQRQNGTALHVRSFLIAPTRPGRALSAVAERRLPVG